MYTGLKNKAIGEIFGASLSAVNKAALRLSILRRKQKGLGERLEKITYPAFDRLSENTPVPYKAEKHLLKSGK